MPAVGLLLLFVAVFVVPWYFERGEIEKMRTELSGYGVSKWTNTCPAHADRDFGGSPDFYRLTLPPSEVRPFLEAFASSGMSKSPVSRLPRWEGDQNHNYWWTVDGEKDLLGTRLGNYAWFVAGSPTSGRIYIERGGS